MDNDRRTAFLILKDVEENKGWSNLVSHKYIKKEKVSSPAFVRELVYGVLRNKLLLDYNINRFLKKGKTGVSEKIWLRMGFYQLSMMGGVKDHAAINETVELARKFKRGSEGFINGVLRSFQRSGCELVYPDPSDESYLSIRYSADMGIARLWEKSYGKDNAEILLFASCSPAPLSLRPNILKDTKEGLENKLSELGFETIERNSYLCKDAVYVRGGDLIGSSLYKEGFFSLQGESSQYAVSILDPKPGSTVLDLCAAPGGKSCAMAERMKGEGKVVAFDIYEHRVKLIEKEAKRLGICIIEARQKDSSVFDKELEGYFDFVLADVPCSGLGTLRENPEIKLRPPDDIDVQGKILENALRYVKKGGRVLYSTCTISPKENEEVIKDCSFLDAHILTGKDEEKDKDFNVIASRQLFTKTGGHDGFYVCLIERRS